VLLVYHQEYTQAHLQSPVKGSLESDKNSRAGGLKSILAIQLRSHLTYNCLATTILKRRMKDEDSGICIYVHNTTAPYRDIREGSRSWPVPKKSCLTSTCTPSSQHWTAKLLEGLGCWNSKLKSGCAVSSGATGNFQVSSLTGPWNSCLDWILEGVRFGISGASWGLWDWTPYGAWIGFQCSLRWESSFWGFCISTWGWNTQAFRLVLYTWSNAANTKSPSIHCLSPIIATTTQPYCSNTI